MRDKNVGKIIYTLRTCNHISQEKLARGLCSVAALSRIEACDRIPDKLLLDALLQRLGKSPDKLESIISANDYELYMYREQVQRYVVGKEYDKAKLLLEQYAGKKEAQEKLHKQYILKIKAAISELADNDIEASEQYIEEAIRISMPDGAMYALEHSLLCKCEIQLILMRISHYRGQDKDEKVWEILKKLNAYVKTHYTDEEEFAKIYVSIIRAEAHILQDRGQYEEAAQLYESALSLLGRNGIVLNIRHILVALTDVYEKLGDTEKYEKFKKWKNTLESLYKKYGIQYLEGISTFLAENRQCEILLVNELIQRGRVVKGMTQEKLSEDICTPENLSAIESGKRAPSIKHYDKIMDKLGMQKDFYNSFLSAERFEIHELRRECNRLIQQKKYDEAAEILAKMEPLIDMEVPVNKQYILFNKTLLKRERENADIDETLCQIKEILNLTLPYKDGMFKKDVVLTQEEAKIANYMAVLYREKNERQKAITLYKNALKGYKNSKVSDKGHYTGLSLVITNLALTLEEENELDESIEIAEKGIEQVLWCGRGSLLPHLLANLAVCYDKKGNKKACEEYLKQAFYVSDIMKNEYFCNAIKQYCEAENKDIQWY